MLERRLIELENKNLSTTNVLSALLTAYARNKDIVKAEVVRKVGDIHLRIWNIFDQVILSMMSR